MVSFVSDGIENIFGKRVNAGVQFLDGSIDLKLGSCICCNNTVYKRTVPKPDIASKL